MTAPSPLDPDRLADGPDAAVALGPCGESGLSGWAYVPAGASPRAPLLVAIHGISRDARAQIRAFGPVAERRGWVLVAPEFDEVRHGDYQRMGRVGRGARADHALDALLAACTERFDLDPARRFLSGFSGGGQFVHRYAMAHPERVDAAIVGAAGWFTFPDAKRAYPYGLRVGAELPGVRLAPRAFLPTPTLVFVGDRDVERDESLRRTRTLDRRQGRHRVARAERWTRSMNALARRHGLEAPVRLRIVEGAGHDFDEICERGVVPLVESFLAGVLDEHDRSASRRPA